MAPGFVEYLEEHADAALGLETGSLMRLATALQTTPSALAGGGLQSPPGVKSGLPPSALTAMTRKQAMALIAAGGVGRIAFLHGDQLLVLPVNYRMIGGAPVFRTAGDSVLASAPDAPTVTFEVDRLDDAMAEGWSVVAQGTCRRVTDPDEIRRAEAAKVEPWAAGDRPLYISVAITTISGRRLRRETPSR